MNSGSGVLSPLELEFSVVWVSIKPKGGDFLVCPLELGLQPETAVGAIGSPTAGVDGGILGQGDDMQYGRPNVLLPAFGKRDFGRFLVRGHDSSAWLQMLS